MSRLLNRLLWMSNFVPFLAVLLGFTVMTIACAFAWLIVACV